MISENTITSPTLWPRLFEILFDVTVIAAMLYVLGKARTQATYWELGVNPSLVRLSPTEYLVRSMDVVVPPFIVLAIVGLALGICHKLLVAPALRAGPNTRMHKVFRRLLLVGSVFGSSCLGLVLVGVIAQDSVGKPLWVALPAALAIGTGTLSYSLRAQKPNRLLDEQGRWVFRTLTCLCVLGILWAGLLYAEWTGKKFAQHFATTLASQPEVLLHSHKQLGIIGPGVTTEENTAADTEYRFCYRGLRLILRTDDQYILAPVGWQWGRDSLHLIPVSNKVRVDPLYSNTTAAAKPPVCSTRS